MTKRTPPQAVFLDRDGTVLEETDERVLHPRQVRVFEDAARGIALLNAASIPVFVVTNQAVVGRGQLSDEGLFEVHVEMQRQLGEWGATVDDIFYCPHEPGPDATPRCACRKPRPGLLLKAAKRYSLNLTQTVVVGDDVKDLEAAAAVGATSVLVRTGKGATWEPKLKPGQAQHVAADLRSAVEWILKGCS